MPAPKRRWTFTLRTLFVVVTVFGIACWVDRDLQVVHERQAIRAQLEGRGVRFTRNASVSPPSVIPTLRQLLGDEPADQIVFPSICWTADPELMFYDDEELRETFPEAELVFTY